MKMWIAREPSGLLVLSEHKMIWCTDHWYAPADDILDLHDKNQYPEVTFENSPMEVELVIKKNEK